MCPLSLSGRALCSFRVVDYYRPIFWITPLKAAGEKGYSLSVGFLFQEEGAPLPAAILAGQRRRAEPRYTTILFIPLSAPPHSSKRIGPRVAPRLFCDDVPL